MLQLLPNGLILCAFAFHSLVRIRDFRRFATVVQPSSTPLLLFLKARTGHCQPMSHARARNVFLLVVMLLATACDGRQPTSPTPQPSHPATASRRPHQVRSRTHHDSRWHLK